MSTTSSTWTDLEIEQLQREQHKTNAARLAAIEDFGEALASCSLDKINTASALVSRLVQDATKWFDELKKRAPVGNKLGNLGILNELSSDVIALMSLRCVLKGCMAQDGNSTPQSMMVKLGKQLWTERMLNKANSVNPTAVFLDQREHSDRFMKGEDALFKKARETAARVLKELYVMPSNADLAQIGKHGVECCTFLELIQKVDTKRNGKSYCHYILTPEIESFIVDEGYDLAELTLPNADVMVCPPKEWTATQWGGYLSPTSMAANRLVVKRGDGAADLVNTVMQAPKALETVNYLQSIELELDEDAVKLVAEAWAIGGNCLGLPSSKPLPEPVFPFAKGWDKTTASEEELTTFKMWARDKSWWYTNEIERKQKVLSVNHLLRSLKDLAGRSIWCPVFLDWRGRAYYHGAVNPQGADYIRACLLYKSRKRLGKRGLFWLKVHIANSLGYDKEPFENRAKWTEQNWDALVQGCDAPWDHEPYKSCGDYPVTACVAVRQLRDAYKLKCPEDYESGMPVHMDASCSGQQMFAGVLRDERTALTVNVKAKSDGKKADIYTYVAEQIKDILREQDTVISRTLLNLNPDRALCKKPTMTQPYGAAHMSFFDTCLTWIVEKNPELKGEANELANELTRVLMRALKEAIPAVSNCMEWFKEVCRQNRGKAVSWMSPMGFLVTQDYFKSNTKKVCIRSTNHRNLTFTDGKAGINNRRMVNGISPNVIHTLDAGLMSRTALSMRDRGLQMLSIHDSFSAHPCDVDTLHRVVRYSYAQLFEEFDILKELSERNGVECTLQKGTLDVQDVLKSQFFFS